MYMARPDNDYGDPTRVNEGIQVFARGRNPMVQVDMGQGQGVKSPYKLDVVRPPMMPIETLVAISAPHIHQNYAVHTNPGSDLTFPNVYRRCSRSRSNKRYYSRRCYLLVL
jgi:hypothetical protein